MTPKEENKFSESDKLNDQQVSQVQELSFVDSLQSDLDPVKLQQLEQIQQERLRFDAEFLELLDSGSSSGRLMFAFVRRELRNFHLDRLYREAFVLNTAYIRGVERIATGEIIQNPSAWLRGTTYRIIRELRREQQKTCPLEEDIPEAQPSTISLEDVKDDFATLRMAFQMLPPQDQRLLHLKIVEERSWREIREILKLEGRGDHTEVTLRKRKERALIRLRKKYHAIKPPEF
jgi:DNA-directed RNA polymerase specialized sigma24 family protein